MCVTDYRVNLYIVSNYHVLPGIFNEVLKSFTINGLGKKKRWSLED